MVGRRRWRVHARQRAGGRQRSDLPLEWPDAVGPRCSGQPCNGNRPREIQIDHANWWGGTVARNIPVVDVSEANDWTAVRVGLGRSGEFGSVYPTYGFIYDRPDTGKMVASTHAPAPQADLNPAPSDLRPATERGWQAYEEVAEAPAPSQHRKQPVHAVATHRRQIVSLAIDSR